MNKDLTDISRRSFLAGAGAMAVSAGLAGPVPAGQMPSTKSPSRSGLGEWIFDGSNLPAYLFTADLPLHTVDAAGKPYPLDPDPFFLIGNYRLTVFPKVSGLYRIVSGERGWTRLNEPLSSAEQNGASLEITRSGQKKVYELLGLSGICADSKSSRRQFGCGYVRYEISADRDINVVRTLSIAPSDDKALGQPAHRHHTTRKQRSLGLQFRLPGIAALTSCARNRVGQA